MKVLLVYPFSQEIMQVVRYYKELTDYTEIVLVSESKPYFASEEKIDVSYLDGGSPVSAHVEMNFENALKIATDVMFVDDFRGVNMFNKYFELAKKLDKEIFLSGDFADIKAISIENFHHLCAPGYLAEVDKNNKLFEIPVPVILVMGQGERCNKFDIQLGLRKKILNEGYEVSQVGTKDFC